MKLNKLNKLFALLITTASLIAGQPQFIGDVFGQRLGQSVTDIKTKGKVVTTSTNVKMSEYTPSNPVQLKVTGEDFIYALKFTSKTKLVYQYTAEKVDIKTVSECENISNQFSEMLFKKYTDENLIQTAVNDPYTWTPKKVMQNTIVFDGFNESITWGCFPQTDIPDDVIVPFMVIYTNHVFETLANDEDGRTQL